MVDFLFTLKIYSIIFIFPLSLLIATNQYIRHVELKYIHLLHYDCRSAHVDAVLRVTDNSLPFILLAIDITLLLYLEYLWKPLL